MTTWLRDGQTVYELNESGTNRWSAHVMPCGSAQTTADERERIATMMRTAPELYDACLAMLPYLPTPTDLLNYAATNDGQASGYDVAAMKIRRALDKVDGSAPCLRENG